MKTQEMLHMLAKFQMTLLEAEQTTDSLSDKNNQLSKQVAELTHELNNAYRVSEFRLKNWNRMEDNYREQTVELETVKSLLKGKKK